MSLSRSIICWSSALRRSGSDVEAAGAGAAARGVADTVGVGTAAAVAVLGAAAAGAPAAVAVLGAVAAGAPAAV
ncbi:MAG: hypothetical protein QF462_12735, partial [Myxococcota bacterium]|nr:hypothetical protein [Myxococcota bacterium]